MKRRSIVALLPALPFVSFITGCSKPPPSVQPPLLPVSPADADPSAPIAAPARQHLPDIYENTTGAAEPAAPKTDRLLSEKLLYNIGWQSNLAACIRQHLNLFSLLYRPLTPFQQGKKLDVMYLLPGINNTPLFKVVFDAYAAYAEPEPTRLVNETVKQEDFRNFIEGSSMSYYMYDAFLDYSSRPFAGSDWRRQALLRLNSALYLDSLSAAVLRPMAPILLRRMRVPVDAASQHNIEQAATSIAFARSSWGARNLSDQQLYALVRTASAEPCTGVFRLITGSIAVTCKSLADSMNESLPADLSGYNRKALDAIRSGNLS